MKMNKWIFPVIANMPENGVIGQLVAVQPMAGPVSQWSQVSQMEIELTCMRQIKVNKSKLVTILKKNREEHRGLFLEAQKAFRQAAIEALDQQLKFARDGKPFRLNQLIQLQAPQDHTKEYDICIAMLEMSVEKEVLVSDQEFQNFVQDTWSWSRQWALSNSSYVSQKSRYYSKISAMAGSEEE